MPRKKVGRPFTVYTPERVEEIRKLFNGYIENTEIPIVCEFCYQNNIPSNRLYEIEELADTLKKCTDKKQAQLERKTYSGHIEKSAVTMAIFSLKQMGWKDAQHVVVQDDKKLSDEQLDEEIEALINELKITGSKGRNSKKAAPKKIKRKAAKK